MFLRTLTAAVLCGLFFVSHPALAQKKGKYTPSVPAPTNSSSLYGPVQEVSLSATTGELTSASGTTGLRLAGNYKKFIKEGMEVGGRVDMWMVTFGNSSYTFTGLWGSFTYNLNSLDLNNTYYFTGMLGMVDEALSGKVTTTSDKKFSYALYAGRRFPWMDKLYWSPEAGIRKIGDTDMAIVLNPVNITVLW